MQVDLGADPTAVDTQLGVAGMHEPGAVNAERIVAKLRERGSWQHQQNHQRGRMARAPIGP